MNNFNVIIIVNYFEIKLFLKDIYDSKLYFLLTILII